GLLGTPDCRAGPCGPAPVGCRRRRGLAHSRGRGGHAAQPGGELREPFRGEAVADRGPPSLRRDQSRLAQRLQVRGDRRLRYLEELGEVAGADPRLRGQALQDAPAHRVRQGPQHIDLVGHAHSVSPRSDIRSPLYSQEAMMSDRSGPLRHGDVLDESLARLAATGPEWGGGLSNHGPMAAEAMIGLGHQDDVARWLDRYLRRLEEPPRPTGRITDQTWRAALGDPHRVADWELYLREQLAEDPWPSVLARWWPRLVPGLAAAATHGIIRTSHAARGLAAGQTNERVAGLAPGLPYGPAPSLELPGPPRPGGPLALDAAARGLPGAGGRASRGFITERTRASLSGAARSPAATGALRPPADVPADLLRLGTVFART